MAKADLTAARLREILHYEPETGLFTWAKDVMCGHRREQMKFRAGSAAGSKNAHGYVMIGIQGRSYRAHRLAWLYVHGEWPASLLDHRNEDKADNRMENLRIADKSLNGLNVQRPRINNRSGFKGVSFHPLSGLWHAAIKINNKKTSLGYHKTPEAAHAAYLTGKRRLAPEACNS